MTSVTADSTHTERALECLQCWQFKTDQAADEKKVDELNRFFLHLMAGMDASALPDAPIAADAGTVAAGKKRSKRKN